MNNRYLRILSLNWQSRGRRFESHLLHKLLNITRRLVHLFEDYLIEDTLLLKRAKLKLGKQGEVLYSPIINV